MESEAVLDRVATMTTVAEAFETFFAPWGRNAARVSGTDQTWSDVPAGLARPNDLTRGSRVAGAEGGQAVKYTTRPSADRAGLNCPECGYPRSQVRYTRPNGSRLVRRRACLGCGARFTTWECIVSRTEGSASPDTVTPA